MRSTGQTLFQGRWCCSYHTDLSRFVLPISNSSALNFSQFVGFQNSPNLSKIEKVVETCEFDGKEPLFVERTIAISIRVLGWRCETFWSKETPPPRGGFVFTMFPDQEPCVRGPPSKNLVQILRGGSSYARLEGTGTRPDYLMIVMPKNMRGHSRKKLHKNREIIV